MTIKTLTYAALAERLKCALEAARSFVAGEVATLKERIESLQAELANLEATAAVTGQTTNASAIGLTAWSPNCSRRPPIRLGSWWPSWRPKLRRSGSLPIMVAMAALYRATPVEHLLGLSRTAFDFPKRPFGSVPST